MDDRTRFRAALCTVAAVFAAAVASGHAVAQSWSWTYRVDSPHARPAELATFTRPDANGFWALGTYGLQHFLPDGSADAFHATPLSNTFRLSASFADGGVLLDSGPSTWVPSPCFLAAYSPLGALRWVRSSGLYDCEQLAIDGHNVAWLRNQGGSLLAFSADGALLHVYAPLADVPVSAVAVNPIGEGVIAATPDSLQSRTTAGIGWTWSDHATAIFDAIAFNRDGTSIYAAGRTGTSGAAAVHLTSLTDSGTPRFSRDISLQVTAIHALAIAADGAVYIVDTQSDAGTGSHLALQKISEAGEVLWNENLGGAAQCALVLPDSDNKETCGLTVVADDDVLLATTDAALLRFDRNGNPRFALAPPVAGFVSYAVLGDSSVLLSVLDDDQFTYRLTQVDMTGQVAPVLPDPTTGDSFRTTLSSTDPDGSSFVLADDYDGFRLTKISADGEALWDRYRNSTDANSLITGGALACAVENRALSELFYFDAVLACYRADSGAPAWTATLGTHVFGYTFALTRVLDDGNIALVNFDSSTAANAQSILFDENGTELSHSALPWPLNNAVIAGNGVVSFVSADFSRLLAYSRNGNLLYDVPIPPQMLAASGLTETLTSFPDGSTLVTGSGNVPNAATYTPYAWLVDAAGHTLWLQALADAQPTGNGDYYYDFSTDVAGPGVSGTLYFLQRVYRAYGVSQLDVQARSRSAGTLLWRNEALPFGDQGNKLVAAADGQRLLLLGNQTRTIESFALDPASGAVVRHAVSPCLVNGGPAAVPYSGAACQWNNATIRADGTLLIDALISDDSAAAYEQLFAMRDVVHAPPAVRIDQPGLDGAWYPVYTTGQGFTFDWIASAKTIFMPWFTFSQSPVNDPAGLAWYTLQGGGIAAGATSADLAIAVSDPGTFNSGGVAGRQIGTAHLSFSDCNNGTLMYQFDAPFNGGAGGLIALTRLTPGTSACVLADGSTQPAQNANAPANGFDARQSGSWFDPATGGQGVEMTIIPAGVGTDGLVFIPWFTFDPDGLADDASNQHWFTLQGDLTTAINGKVTLPIFRIIGGAFDAGPTTNYAQVGHATLSLTGCDSAQLDFVFDGSAVAHAFAGRSGSTHLVKIGGCTAP